MIGAEFIITNLTAVLINCFVTLANNYDQESEVLNIHLDKKIDEISSVIKKYIDSMETIIISSSDVYSVKYLINNDALVSKITEIIKNSGTKDELCSVITKDILSLIDNRAIKAEQIQPFVNYVVNVFYQKIIEDPKLSPYLVITAVEKDGDKTRRQLGLKLQDIIDKISKSTTDSVTYSVCNDRLSYYDKTYDDEHFSIFKHDSIKISDLYIEPNYKIIRFFDLEKVEVKDGCSFCEECIKILERQRALFIVGKYGTGKTFLSKYIQHKLTDQNKNTAFINCSEISYINKKHELAELVLEKKGNSKSLYLIFDAYDEMNFLANDKIDITDEFIINAISLTKIDGVYIIINTRPIFENEDEVYSHLSYMLSDQLTCRTVEFVRLEHFSNSQISKWLDSYSNEIAKTGVEKRLYPDDLKRLHKHLKNSCHNQLFLYMLVNCYYVEGEHSVDNIYYIYKSFVESTIKGKFKYEKPGGSKSIKEISKSYKEFLIRIASDISSRHKLVVEPDQFEEWHLDSSTNQYVISHGELALTINKIADKLLGKNLLENLDDARLRANIIACYFLEYSNGNWKFRDNNILYYLISESYFDLFQEIIDTYDTIEDKNLVFQRVSRKGCVNLHPMSVAILFSRIGALHEGVKARIVFTIKKFIEHGHILQVRDVFTDDINASKLNLNLLFCITYMQLNRDGYHDISYYFKRLSWYVSAAKIIDRNYLYLVMMFFKNTRIYNVEFRRINFDGYNFENSKFNEIKFIQVKMHKTRLDGTNFINTKFILSDLHDVTMNKISGTVTFENCRLTNIHMEDLKDVTVEFRRCQIANMHISSRNKHISDTIKLKFYGCDIENLIARRTKLSLLKMERCFSNTIKVERSFLNFSDKDCFFTNMDKKFQSDTNTEIRDARE